MRGESLNVINLPLYVMKQPSGAFLKKSGGTITDSG
jgi:hypothetical protein